MPLMTPIHQSDGRQSAALSVVPSPQTSLLSPGQPILASGRWRRQAVALALYLSTRTLVGKVRVRVQWQRPRNPGQQLHWRSLIYPKC
jgi:hypothetical protein